MSRGSRQMPGHVCEVSRARSGKIETCKRHWRGGGDKSLPLLRGRFIREVFQRGLQALHSIRSRGEGTRDERKCWAMNVSYIPQTGEDLGERMKLAFLRCFSEGARSVVLIGSDIPDLPARIVDEAFRALDKCGAVIGPSVDGGYYLIGFREDTFCGDVFAGTFLGRGDGFSGDDEYFAHGRCSGACAPRMAGHR